MARKLILTLGCLILLLSVGGAGAATEMDLFKGQRFEGGPWRIRADTVTYDAANHLYTAEGNVEIRQGDRRIIAQQVEVNEATKIARVKGNVVLVLDEDIFTGQEGQFNLATRCGEMTGARLFLKKNHFHVDSPLIRKTGDKTYYAEEAKVTTCDADRPVWSFSTRKLSVVLEGYATGRDGLLHLAGVPVLYLPLAVLPVMTSRQSGFLLPTYGQHRAGGSVVEAPFYWAISNYSDLTLYQTVFSNRGYMQGGEYRRRGHDEAAANFRFFYMNDSYTENTTNRRYWASGMINQPLGDWEARGTLDRVSDSKYLADFNFGYMGLNRYSRELLMEFGRDLEQEEVNTRVSNFSLARNFSVANLTLHTRYYEKLVNNDPNLFNRLPGASLNSVPLSLGGLPIYLGLNSSYNYFYQNHGMTGDRLDFHPYVSLQGQPLPGISFGSRVGFRETVFRVDHTVPEGPPEKIIPRQLFDSRVALGGAWARDFGRGSESSYFFRHILRPEVAYTNVPRFNPRRYPQFDPLDQGWVARVNRNLPVREGDDPVGGVNALTYGIANNILWRSQNEQGQTTVREVLWFRLSQSSFFNKSSMGLDGNSVPHHPFSDFWSEVQFYPLPQLILGSNLGVSPYQEGFDRADFKVTILDKQRQNYINVNYVYVKDFAKQINVEAYLNLMKSVKTWVTYGHTFETNNQLEKRYGVVLQRDCLGVVLSYTDRPNDQRIGFTVFIPGLGEKMKRSPVRFPDESKHKDSPDLF
ncbi:MAG: LPS assembly protein LptD [Desulfobacterales bacterium]|nr:LPS assembly protein LptD [Pseudomonadota bacterium]MCG2773365.1 LPS assembly protein LptD [Desulfobacterales bacterium]